MGKSEECLIRETPLPRSSKVSASNRPKAFQHYDSMRVRELLFDPKEIVLVDDVITRGTTVLGAVNRLAETFPKAFIRVFAVMRTISNPDDFSKIVDPCTGTISLVRENTFREPWKALPLLQFCSEDKAQRHTNQAEVNDFTTSKKNLKNNHPSL